MISPGMRTGVLELILSYTLHLALLNKKMFINAILLQELASDMYCNCVTQNLLCLRVFI